MNNYIKSLRLEKNYSQDEVAKLLGISRPTYIGIEQGERELYLEEALKLADLYGVDISDFVERKKRVFKVDILKDSPDGKYESSDIRISVPQKNIKKFKEILLYILNKVGGKPNVGETVLYKLLYFIDFDYFEKYEEQIIGATYIKNLHGPTPVEFKVVIDQMIADEEVLNVKNKYFERDQKKYIALRNPNLSKLITAQELAHIDEVLGRLSDKNATQLSEYSHLDTPWIVTRKGKVIDYESVFYRTAKTSVRNYE